MCSRSRNNIDALHLEGFDSARKVILDRFDDFRNISFEERDRLTIEHKMKEAGESLLVGGNVATTPEGMFVQTCR